MTFVTRLTLQSGDRDALERVVEDIKESARRKGAELKGPHADPPADHRVPRYKRAAAGDDGAFPPWQYTVYRREVEIVGHDGFARDVAGRSFPPGVHVSVEVEQRSSVGS